MVLDKIKACIIFTIIDQKSSGIIDYIAVKEDHQNGNIGCFLINLIQEITSKKIQQAEKFSRLSSCFTVYLACQTTTVPIYKSYRFQIISDLGSFKQKGTLYESGMRLEYAAHSETHSNQLVILMIDTHCRRVVNYVNYIPLDVESTCFHETRL